MLPSVQMVYPNLAITIVSSVRQQVGKFWKSVQSLRLVHLFLKACTVAATASQEAITRKEKTLECLSSDMDTGIWHLILNSCLTTCALCFLHIHRSFLCAYIEHLSVCFQVLQYSILGHNRNTATSFSVENYSE